MTEAEPPGGADERSLQIDAPETSPNDERIEIWITGADPEATVRFEATLVDHGGVEWRSNGTFLADEEGHVVSNIAIDRLERSAFDHRFEHLTYDDAGHLISVPYAPLTGFDAGGGTSCGTAHAAVESWPAILDVLADGTASENV
jgi:hypothetical protein